MNTQRQIQNARILKHIQYQLAGDFKVINIKTRRIGTRNGESVFAVDYFCTSKYYVGGKRYERVAVTDKKVSTLYNDDF